MRKRFSENRVVAWIVFAVAVIFSLSFSGGGALKELREQTLSIFYNGAQDDGLSIDRDLQVRSDAAYNLASVASGYAQIDAQVVTRTQEAQQALEAADSIAAKSAANQQLSKAVEDLFTAISNAPLTESDRAFVFSQYKEFISRGDTISRDVYNERARAFNDKLHAFPASLIGGFSGVKPVEIF